jgi:hypothetical protein
LRRHTLGKVVISGLLALVACGGNPDQVSPEDSSPPADAADEGLGDGSSEAGADASTDVTVSDSTVTDATSDTTEPPDGTMLTESGLGEASVTEAGGSGTEAASPEAGGAEAGNDDAGIAETGVAETGAPDAAREASACTIAGNWSITVQTTTAVPTLCQGIMNCTNCDVQSNATATQPTTSTIQWTLDPGGTLCNAFSGTVSPTGAFDTGETDCSPIGDGTTFDGQVDVATCSMTATYVYVLTSVAGTCTVTYAITGTQ